MFEPIFSGVVPKKVSSSSTIQSIDSTFWIEHRNSPLFPSQFHNFRFSFWSRRCAGEVKVAVLQ